MSLELMEQKLHPYPNIPQYLRGLLCEVYLHIKAEEPLPNSLTQQLRSLLSTQNIPPEMVLQAAGPVDLILIETFLKDILPAEHPLNVVLNKLVNLEGHRTLPHSIEELIEKFEKVFLVLGKAASGKGTAVEIMTKSFPIKGMPSSSWLRSLALIRKQGQNATNLKELGDELRRKYGPGILAELTLRDFAAQEIPLVVIDGLRSMEEIQPFLNQKQQPNDRVVLIWIETPDEDRLARIKQRGRQGDPTNSSELKDFDLRTFPQAPQIKQLCKQHGKIIPNMGTIQDLRKAIFDLMTKLGILQQNIIG